MKTTLALALVLAGFAAAPAAQAAECYVPVKKYVCAPVYSYTKQIGCRTECRWAKDECGRRYSYEVRVVTYADYYTDGSRRTYAKTLRS